MRASVGHALNSSHLETIESRESDIDRVGALARASRLGALLFHWRYAKQDRFARAVLSEVVRKSRRRFQISEFHVEHPALVAACKQAMREYYAPQCSTCNGAREIIEQKLRIVCHTCRGAGVRRYSDYERANALGMNLAAYRAGWEKRLGEILSMLAANDAGASGVVRYQLRENS